MVFIKLTTVLLLFCSLLYVSSSNINENEAAKSDNFSPHIETILKYLNSNPNRVYDYKRGIIISTQRKANVVEILADVDVSCINKYPGLPCTEHSLTCHGFVGEEKTEYQVLSDVTCSPKIEISIENVDENKPLPPVGRVYNGNTNIELSNEAVSAEQGADFVAVRRDSFPCLGCPYDLNTDAEGVEELLHTALNHLESERNERHRVLKVLRLQQQVVAGVKYILIVEVAPTICQKDADISQPCPLIEAAPSAVCKITFIQQPWINKNKHIINNNCTISQEYAPQHSRDERDELDNEIDANVAYNNKRKQNSGFHDKTPYYNNIAESGNFESEQEISPARLADIESQILFGDDFGVQELSSSSKPDIVSMVTIESERPNSVYLPQTLSVPEGQPIITDIVTATTEEPKSFVALNTDHVSPLYSSLPVVEERDPVTTFEKYTPNEEVQSRTDTTLENDQKPTFKIEEPDHSVVTEKNINTTLSEESNEDTQVIKKDLTTESPSVTYYEVTEPSIKKHTLPESVLAEEKSSELSEENNSEESSNEQTTSSLDNKVARGKRGCPRPYKDLPENDIKRDKNEPEELPTRIVKREVANDESHSESKSHESHENESNSGSEEDEDRKNKKSIVKREKDSDSASKSRESHENDSNSGSEQRSGGRVKKSIVKRGKDESDSDSKSSESHEKNRNKLDSHSSESHSREDSDEKKGRGVPETTPVVPEVTTIAAELRVKRDTNRQNDDEHDTSSSSSSSSSSSEEDTKDRKRDNEVEPQEKGRDHSSSSSSSSSSEEDNNKSFKSKYTLEVKLKKKNKDDHDSSSSSSSSESHEHDNKKAKEKRSVRQMEKITPDEKVVVRDLADFAAATLDKIDEDNHKRVILQILGAKKLKLDGIYYQIILRLGISHCVEHDNEEKCHEKLFTNLTKICKVQVHVDDDLSNPKVVKSQCQNIKKDENDRNRTNYSRYKRQVLVGGASNIPIDDPRIQEYISEPLSYLDSKSSHENKHKILRVLSATSQVVSGVKYVIKAEISLSDCNKHSPTPPEQCGQLENGEPKTCKIEIWDQPWLNKKQTTIKCDDDTVHAFESASKRAKRSVGSESELEVGVSDYVNELLSTGLSHLAEQKQEQYKVMRVISVKKQLVAGFLWTVEAEIGSLQCETDVCQDGSNKVCEFKVWDKPWLVRRTNITCSKNDQVYSFLSFKKPSKNVNRAYLERKATEFIKTALEYLDSKSLFNTRYTLNNIQLVTAPVKDGGSWHIQAEIARSDCVKQYNDDNCRPIGPGILCNLTVSDNRNPASDYFNITCDNDANAYAFAPDMELRGEIDYEYTLRAFKDFIVKHNKKYSNMIEYNYRLKVFKDNLKTIHLLNLNEQGTGQYGVTKFADLTQKEFSKSHGLRMDLKSENEISFMQATIPPINITVEFDWRKKNAVTEVKNQGMCGSCWAFSVTGNVEGQYAIKHGNLTEFSEQELVDCDKVDDGCDGGLMDNAYRVIEKLGGLESESDYPYEGEDEKCHFDKTKIRVELTGALNISHNETDMAKWLVANGPISIAINANAMQFYMGGVSHPYKVLCNPKNLDHGVLIVGYGVHKYPLFKKALPFWIVKNSWGTSWGEQGYYRVYRGDGTCGLNQTPSSAVVA